MKTKDLPQIDGITVHCAHDSIVPVGDLKPYPRNNKTHPEAQISLMCKAIKAQGWRTAITVSNQSGYIVRGHGRLEAAKRLGLKAAPVDFQDYASPAAEQADRIADNKLAELAEYDMDALKEELLELDTGALDMDITGFDAGALEGLMTACPPQENEPENTGPKMPFGLRYGPRLVRRKGHATMAACLYGGEQNIIDAVKSWKENGENGDTTSVEAANAIAEMIKECGLMFASVTTPQRHHEGFHGATSIANCAAKIMGVPFMDIFGFCKEAKGHHPARNTKREARGAKTPAAKLSPVLVVDDIATSGETLRAACETIREKRLYATAACLVHYWPQ
jgi:predicted amidophosphoribosyltransferase